MLVLTGATASGKTALALELAETLGAEIVALDSMTLYRGLDIGTAKPTLNERGRVRHHLIDVLEPHESASVAWWLEQAHAACREIEERGLVPLFVGGTPFYLKALLHGVFTSPSIDPAVRAALEQEADALGPAGLHAKLAAVDPKTAARLHANDVRRVVRALEIFTATGTPISELQDTWDAPAKAIPIAMLDWPREELVQRIEARVKLMLAAGWLEECRQLLDVPLGKEASQAVGYAELFAHLRGERTLAEAVELTTIRTRQFAKRQLTWFRKLPLAMVPAAGPNLSERVREAWNSVGTA